ncbi:cytochrome c biogenesis protein CcdC [Bacillus carboniphilus]|uniref:Cytochrome c biogenesis protein CcdC n=1 Tax=Bacillus carboniphilus TaxID=86663 RepID=A0ABY9JVP2_9BACI|nr:cytochrome c biogenesis protein CcdC [Bacillus carboniphilus]WLR43450.1 cytochrome c biogenesis protein CcdC [Bacillus carboniphilus]
MNIMLILSSAFAIFMGFFVLFIRMKASLKPVSSKKIILPPIFMSTGALMYVIPFFRISPLQIVEALLVGFIFSILLIKTSNFEVRDGDIYLKRSKAFIFILFGLLGIRIMAKLILSTAIDLGEVSGMFWMLAFGMIVPWRVAMFINYKRIEANLSIVEPKTNLT